MSRRPRHWGVAGPSISSVMLLALGEKALRYIFDMGVPCDNRVRQCDAVLRIVHRVSLIIAVGLRRLANTGWIERPRNESTKLRRGLLLFSIANIQLIPS